MVNDFSSKKPSSSKRLRIPGLGRLLDFIETFKLVCFLMDRKSNALRFLRSELGDLCLGLRLGDERAVLGEHFAQGEGGGVLQLLTNSILFDGFWVGNGSLGWGALHKLAG